MIGGIGLTNCLRAWQLALMSSSTASTWSSSTPTRIVALPCLRNPPEDCRRVVRNSFSRSASTRLPASSLCTMAVTSFIREGSWWPGDGPGRESERGAFPPRSASVGSAAPGGGLDGWLVEVVHARAGNDDPDDRAGEVGVVVPILHAVQD